MADNVYAIERAQEIFKNALESNELNRWQSDLRKIANLTKDIALITLLENPETALDDKVKALSERLVDISPSVLKLISELLTKGKLRDIDEISEEYQRLADNQRGIEGTVTAEITTAITLDNEDNLRIAERLTSIIGKPVVLKTNVDPGLIGGIIIKVGDKLIDGSIRNKLAALKREMDRTAK
ncbi:ATP synthase F1 subunit delta [Chloroflexota bacterium]